MTVKRFEAYAASHEIRLRPMSPGLGRIKAAVLVINAADDERNPPETGLTEAALKQVRNARLVLIPASEETRGHGTTGMAKFYKLPLAELLQSTPAVR